MKTQITEQANGLFAVYTDEHESMSDETLLGFDLTEEQADEIASAETREA